MAFSVCARNAAMAFAVLWMAAMLVTRICALHEEYVAELGIRNDERWLVERCKDPDFYANLRQHSDLCTRVANNAQASIALRVLGRVMERSTHLCGDTSCGDVVAAMAARFGWHAVALLAATMVLAPNLLMMLMRAAMQRRIMSRMEEQAMLLHDHDQGGAVGHHHHPALGAPMMGWFSSDKSFPLTSAGACRRSMYFNRPIQYIGNGGYSLQQQHQQHQQRIATAEMVVEEALSDTEDEEGRWAAPTTAVAAKKVGFGGGMARLI